MPRGAFHDGRLWGGLMQSGDVDPAGDRRHPFPVHPLLSWVLPIGSVVVFEVPPVLEVPIWVVPIRITYIDQTTACTIATSLTLSKIGYCNSLLLNLQWRIQDFANGAPLGGLGTSVPQRGPGAELLVGVWGEAPKRSAIFANMSEIWGLYHRKSKVWRGAGVVLLRRSIDRFAPEIKIYTTSQSYRWK